MGCGSCGGGSCGTASGGCKTGGCNKLNVFDWLADMEESLEQRFLVVEVRFKAGRKEFFYNTNKLELHTGDPIVVESSVGYHIGYVSLQGELVRLQMKKKGVNETDIFPNILRLADAKELDKFDQARARELPTLFRTRNIILEQKLNMKLSDVEYQADNTKATFFYSADDRVDFRELIKLLAGEFRIRVEMRQINLRQEAGRLGGIGVCGRELCCSTWLTNFKNVATSAARYQNLSLNPVKLSGQCGRLKCCLNYELDTYMEALKDIPEISVPLQTKQGKAFLQKTDIFRRIMWFAYSEESNWHALTVEQVNEVITLNKKGEIPEHLTDEPEPVAVVAEFGFGQYKDTDIARLDKKFQNSRNSGKPNTTNNNKDNKNSSNKNRQNNNNRRRDRR
jgi:cell fate regulator YaaT (PSP1 superfamily)